MKFSISTTIVTMQDGVRRWDLAGYQAEIEKAESLGFYAAYKGERRGHGPYSGQHGGVHSPLLIAQYGLARTQSLKFSTGVVLLPLHHPVTVIQDATVLNSLYPGRFRLVVGAGYQKDDFDVYGVDLADRPRRMRIGLTAINAYRSGLHYEFPDDGPWAGIVPERDPAMGKLIPEVYTGAWSTVGVRIAALSDGWETDPIRTVSQLTHFAEIYREECARLGTTPRIVLLREACIAESDEKAREVLGPYVLQYHKIYFQRGNAYSTRWEPWLETINAVDELTLDHVLPDRVLCGSPETWIRTLRMWQAAIQPDEIVLRLRYFHGPGLDVELEALDMIRREVIPHFSDAGEATVTRAGDS